MSAYYNEIDPQAAQWLRNLIAAGCIAPGDVDCRSIKEVQPDDLKGYTQCHFFAGIGVWSYALRNAGWPDDRPVWTGSCPCQDLSVAGKGEGFDGERHLWPDWFQLLRELRPGVVFGEQVTSALGLAWLDLVHADMEGEAYTVGAVDTCSAGVGSPNIRQRFYWVADAGSERRQQEHRSAPSDEAAHGGARRLELESNGDHQLAGGGETHRLDHAAGARHESAGLWAEAEAWNETRLRGLERGREAGGLGNSPGPRWQGGGDLDLSGARRRSEGRSTAGAGDALSGMDDAAGTRHDGALAWPEGEARDEARLRVPGAGRGEGDPGPVNGHWRAADWLYCRDGKWRPARPGTFPLAHGAPARVGRLRLYGNAIVAQVAEEFIRAYLDVKTEFQMSNGFNNERTP